MTFPLGMISTFKCLKFFLTVPLAPLTVTSLDFTVTSTKHKEDYLPSLGTSILSDLTMNFIDQYILNKFLIK